MKMLFAFVIPGGLIYLAAIGFLRPQGLPHWMQAPTAALPFIVLIFGLVFGWYLASGRLILSLFVLAFADRALVLCPPTDPDPASAGQVLYAAGSLLVPLNLLALSLVKDEAIPTWQGIVRLLMVLGQPFAILWLALPDHEHLARALQFPLIPALTVEWSSLAQPALLAFFGAVFLLGIRFVLNRSPLDAGTLWALIASFTAFHGLRYGWAPTNFLSTAGFVLFIALVQASHQHTYRDALTGLLGKAAYDQAVSRLKGRYVFAIVGLDQLKQYGSQHGKPVSEQLLCLIAPKIQAAAGQGQVYRLAGEEFTLLFLRKGATEVLVILEGIRKAIERFTVYRQGTRVWENSRLHPAGSGPADLTLTVSIGLAESQTAQPSPDQVRKAAYRALYQAKAEGGNLVKRGALQPETDSPMPVTMGRIVAYNEFDS
jgi:diguanylate cyclase (GGDEF)-like protein